MDVVCKVCGCSKPMSLFVKQLKQGPAEPWNMRYCKECAHSKYLKRRENPESLAKLHQASRQWKSGNLARHAELAREYRARHPEKIRAQNRLNYAVRKGVVVRQPCEVCGEEKTHAHHVSYAPQDWYNVRWLCGVCHKIEHTGITGNTLKPAAG